MKELITSKQAAHKRCSRRLLINSPNYNRMCVIVILEGFLIPGVYNKHIHGNDISIPARRHHLRSQLLSCLKMLSFPVQLPPIQWCMAMFVVLAFSTHHRLHPWSSLLDQLFKQFSSDCSLLASGTSKKVESLLSFNQTHRLLDVLSAFRQRLRTSARTNSVLSRLSRYFRITVATTNRQTKKVPDCFVCSCKPATSSSSYWHLVGSPSIRPPHTTYCNTHDPTL